MSWKNFGKRPSEIIKGMLVRCLRKTMNKYRFIGEGTIHEMTRRKHDLTPRVGLLVSFCVIPFRVISWIVRNSGLIK